MRVSFWVAAFLALCISIGALSAPLRVSVPPLFGSVPVILASDEGWGLFAEEGVDITLVPLPSQTARMQAFRAGQVDILVSDLTLALMIVSKRNTRGVIAGTTYTAVPSGEDSPPPVYLLSQRYARLDSLERLAQEATDGRVKIGVPRQSDLEYMLDQLLISEGLPTPPSRQVYVGRDDLLQNAEFLGFGRFHAGVFPQPYADYLMAIEFPGKPDFFVLSDFSDILMPPTVLVVSKALLEDEPEEAAAFFRALDAAVDRVNELPREELLNLGWQLVTKLFLPGQEPEDLSPADRQQVEQAIQTMFIPDFPEPAPLDPEPFERVLEWAKRKGYVTFPPAFDEVVVPPAR